MKIWLIIFHSKTFVQNLLYGTRVPSQKGFQICSLKVWGLFKTRENTLRLTGLLLSKRQQCEPRIKRKTLRRKVSYTWKTIIIEHVLKLCKPLLILCVTFITKTYKPSEIIKIECNIESFIDSWCCTLSLWKCGHVNKILNSCSWYSRIGRPE